MVNRNRQPFTLLLAVALVALLGASFVLVKTGDDFRVQARPQDQADRPAGPVVWNHRGVYTGPLTTGGGLPVIETKAVAIADFQPESEAGSLSSADLVSGQDILEERGCVVDPGAGQVNVPLSAFRQAEGSPANGFRFWTEGGYLYSTTATTTMKLVAPVYLPDGANMTHVALVFFDDRSATANITARLIRKDLAIPGVQRQQITAFSSTNTSPTKVLCTSTSATEFMARLGPISNEYSYFAALELPANPELKLDQLAFVLKVYYEPPPQPDSGVAVVPAAAFRQNGDNVNHWLHFYTTGIDTFITSTGPATPTLVAPVYLPPGAILTEFRASVRDVYTRPGRNLTIELRRARQSTGLVETLSRIQTADDSLIKAAESITDTRSDGDLEIVTADYSYYLTLTLPSNPTNTLEILFFGARVFYTKP